MKTNLYILFSTLIAAAAIAQDAAEADSTVSPKHVPYQISFLYPIGTNGYESKNISVDYSLNIIGGIVGNVTGFEAAGMFNAANGSLNGVQAAGFSNVVREDVKGAQLAGFANVALGSVEGTQLAGYASITLEDLNGLQGSGFANVAKGNVVGSQLAGFANVAVDTMTGVQSAGFANYAMYAKKTVIQLAGFANVLLDSTKGVQGAGFMNVIKGDLQGVQLAGFGNVAIGEVTGWQASGFINVADKVKGAQIGFLNIADSVTGISIGFLSMVRHGYNHIEFGGNETFYGNINVKLGGSDRFYNIFALGVMPKKEVLNWGFGYGAGTMIPFSEKLQFNLDVITYHVNEDEWLTDEVNLLVKVSPTLTYKMGDHFALYAGPTMNTLIQNEDINPSTILPWDGYEWKDTQTRVYLYPGVRAGVRF